MRIAIFARHSYHTTRCAFLPTASSWRRRLSRAVVPRADGTLFFLIFLRLSLLPIVVLRYDGARRINDNNADAR